MTVSPTVPAPSPERAPAAAGSSALTGGPLTEHRFVREAAGVLDLTGRGLLLVRGEKGSAPSAAADFLQRILSSDVRSLETCRGQPSCLLTPKGKVVAAFHLYRAAPAEFLLIFAERIRPEALGVLQKYASLSGIEVLREDGDRGILSAQGPLAGEVLRMALEVSELPGEPFRRAILERGGARIAVRRAGETPEGGFELEVPAGALEAARERLSGAAAALGGGPVGESAAEVLRIEAGVPRWDAEIDGTRFPGECGLGDAVSFEKGCFIGQEIIARMRTYGHLNRRLMAVRFPDGREVAAGSSLFRDGDEVGQVTSAAVSPRDGRALALAFLSRKAWDPGTAVALSREGGGAPGEVVELPPVRP